MPPLPPKRKDFALLHHNGLIDFSTQTHLYHQYHQYHQYHHSSSSCSASSYKRIMTVHSFYIFDRKGKTLFTKRYGKAASASSGGNKANEEEEEKLSEQRKLIFGMLFSLRELSSSLSPSPGPGDLQLVKTGAATLYNYETVSGLRFCLYTTPETSYGRTTKASGSGSGVGGSGGTGGVGSGGGSANLSSNLQGPSSSSGLAGGGSSSGNGSIHGTGGTSMTNPQITANVRVALKHIYEHIWVTFVIRSPMYRPHDPDISSTNFEASLDNYLKGMGWFR